MELSVQTHFSQGWNNALIDRVKALGADSIRDSQPWSAVETALGAYNFNSALSGYMNKAASAGVSTTLTFSGGNALYGGGDFTTWNEAQRQAYANDIVATLGRYGGGVSEIEIWNEYNAITATNRDPAYVALLKTVYQTVKPLFPDVVILGGSTNVVGTGAIDAIFKLGAGNYLDGVAVHPYRATAEHLEDELTHLQDVMAKYGSVKPIYATEFGSEFADANDAPALMLKAVTQMASVNVVKANWYALNDQKWWSNMGLFDSAGNAKPAAATFAFLEKTLLPLGNPIKIDTSDEQNNIYRFGADTYVMWGSTRGVTFAAGSTFYNAKGEVIATPTGLSDAPIVVKTSGYTLGETKIVADSFLEFGDTSVWQYYAKSSDGSLATLANVDWDWTSYIGSRYTKPLRFNADSLAPAGDGKNPIQAMERYTSDSFQTVKIVGHWNVGTTGDGIDLHILVNNTEIYSKVFEGALDISDLVVTLAAGDTLDFAAGPNQSVTGDSVTYRVQLVSVDTPAGATPTVPNRILNGTGGNDTLIGGNGSDTFFASLGRDSYSGGAGNDTVSFEKLGLGVMVNLSAAGYATLANNMSAQFVGVENLIGSRFGDSLRGDANDNRIAAGGGNDTLYASAGRDVMDGGDGVDTLNFQYAPGAVNVSLAKSGAQATGFGTTTMVGVENLTGSLYNDVIAGNAGNNVLNGSAGIDTVSYADATGGVWASLASTAQQNTLSAGLDTLSGFENLIGSRYADTLTGAAGDNALSGGDGDDLFRATTGKDRIDGGAGSDTLSFETFATGATIDLSRADQQTVANGTAYTLSSIEHVVGSKYNDVLTGNAGDNSLTGGTGNDTLDGGGGNDRLNGGDGSDTASFVSAANGVTVLLAIAGAQVTGAGTDTLVSIENLSGSRFDDILTGDAGANVLRGGSGNDVLSGGGGNDALDGGAGIDTASYASATAGVSVSLAVTTAQNTLGAGIDTLTTIENLIGSRFADLLKGDANNNMLDGGDGNDQLIAWLGQDTLRGGGGADSFVFRSIQETTVSAPDRILDFTPSQGDKIDLSLMDARSATSADDAFSLGNAFTKQAGQVAWSAMDGGVLLQGDVNGDGKADFAVQVLGVNKLAVSDFIL